MEIKEFIYLVSELSVPVIILIITFLGFVLLYRGKIGKLEIGRVTKLSKMVDEAGEIRERMRETAKEGAGKTNQQYALLQEYHAQGLAQSKISFWFSLIFAAIGFFIIIISILSYVFSNEAVNTELAVKSTLLDSAGKPIFAVIAGTIIDAVAALFFVQSNKARQLMTEFFDKLRIDRKLDESLNVLSKIEDKTISSRVKALLALNFAEIDVTDDMYRRVVSMDCSDDSLSQPTPNKPIQPTANASAD